MPKVSYRCHRRAQQHGSPPVVSVAFMAAPRKVSFEDGHPDPEAWAGPTTSRSSACTSSPSPPPSPVLRPIVSDVRPLSRTKSTLFRPKSSLSLVDLAKRGVESEDHHSSSPSSCSVVVDAHRLSPPAPVSPMISSPRLLEQYQHQHLASSPWGQFVDMALQEDERTSGGLAHSSHQQQHSYGMPCSCCTTCRRRRSNPYGDYKQQSSSCSSKHENPIFSSLSSSPLGLFQDPDWSTTSRGIFRLSPRKDQGSNTEALIADLDRLQVD